MIKKLIVISILVGAISVLTACAPEPKVENPTATQSGINANPAAKTADPSTQPTGE